jgi:ligand-binding sensor domain-containing protein
MSIRNISTTTVLLLFIALIMISCAEDEDTRVSFSLPSNIIHKIVTDKNGNKWIATEKGLVCFDGYKWNPYPDIYLENNISVADLTIGSAETDKIWFARNDGVSFLKFTTTDIISTWSFAASDDGLLSDTVTAVAADAMNVKYFGNSLGLSILKDDQWTTFFGRTTEEILRDYRISSIAAAKNGWVYAATYGGGVSRFKYTDAVSGATTFDTDWSQLKSNYVNSVTIVDDTCQWYGTDLGAAFHTSHYTKIISDWTTYTQADGLISDTVLSIAKDLSGNVWFGTNHGVSRLSGSTFTNFTTSDGLSDNKVNTISIDNNGSVWFGTDNGLTHLQNDSWTTYRND